MCGVVAITGLELASHGGRPRRLTDLSVALAREGGLVSGGTGRLLGTRHDGPGLPDVNQNCLGVPTAHTWEGGDAFCWRAKPRVRQEAGLAVEGTLVAHPQSSLESRAFSFAWDLDLGVCPGG